MTIGLAMIVRDGADTIQRALNSARPVIDTWSILDTGSTDETPAIIRDELRDIPGNLHHTDWQGFGPARTKALELARDTADYVLMVDADMTVKVVGDRPELTADAYMLRILDGNLTWRLPLLTKATHPFEYRGAAHAYLASDQPAMHEPTDWITIDGGKGATVEKLERDLGLLTGSFADDPSDTRTVFYLARTHDDLDHVHEAITWYRLRAAMGGWSEEVYYSRYRLGVLLGEHVAFADAAPELLNAWNDAPHRAEALRALANLANSVADKIAEPEGLFVHPGAYRKEPA